MNAAEPVAERRPGTWFRVALATLVVLVTMVLVGRSSPDFVGWQLLRAHKALESSPPLRLSLWTSDPHVASRWLEARGGALPLLPGRTRGLDLVGVRYAVLLDRIAVHAVYGGESRLVSVFLLSGPAWIGSGHRTTLDGNSIGLLRLERTIVGIVAATPEEVEAFEGAFSTVWVRHPLIVLEGVRGARPGSWTEDWPADGPSV